MAETTDKIEKLPPLPPQVVTRNEVDEVLGTFQIVKGEKRKGKQYLAPVVDFSTPEKWENMVKWTGLSTVAQVLQTFLKKTFQDIWFNAIDETTGLHNMEKFLLEAKDFTTSGMKLAEIYDKMEEAQAEVANMISSMPSGDDATVFAAWKTKINEINDFVLALKAMAEQRSKRGKQAEDASEPSVAVA